MYPKHILCAFVIYFYLCCLFCRKKNKALKLKNLNYKWHFIRHHVNVQNILILIMGGFLLIKLNVNKTLNHCILVQVFLDLLILTQSHSMIVVFMLTSTYLWLYHSHTIKMRPVVLKLWVRGPLCLVGYGSVKLLPVFVDHCWFRPRFALAPTLFRFGLLLV